MEGLFGGSLEGLLGRTLAGIWIISRSAQKLFKIGPDFRLVLMFILSCSSPLVGLVTIVALALPAIIRVTYGS